jgi:uncharacterized membrane protein YhdT
MITLSIIYLIIVLLAYNLSKHLDRINIFSRIFILSPFLFILIIIECLYDVIFRPDKYLDN